MQSPENPEPASEKVRPEVVFTNQLTQSEHAIDESFNAMKRAFVTHIKMFIETDPLFKDDYRVTVTFGEKGVSSIIAILETATQKLVLKIPRSKDFSAGEGEFLLVWEAVGVTVPHVYETGEMHGQPYALMEFIDAPILSDVAREEELLEQGKYEEMGQILRKMHATEVDGYGFSVAGKPEFSTVEEWLAGPDMKTRFEYIAKHKLLDSLEDQLAESLDVIKRHAEVERSTYCHDDYGIHNMFATEPITVFDANPKFNNRYYELGRIVFADIAFRDSRATSEQLLRGYFGGETCNTEVLRAYTFLAYCMKCPYWHQTNRTEQLKKAREYFAAHRD